MKSIPVWGSFSTWDFLYLEGVRLTLHRATVPFLSRHLLAVPVAHVHQQIPELGVPPFLEGWKIPASPPCIGP